AAYYTEDVPDTTGERPEHVRRATVTPGFLDLWGIDPALGRRFTTEDYLLGGRNVALISDQYWRRLRGARSDILGTSVVIDGQSLVVVGVMPPEFAAVDRRVDLWAPHPVD